MTDIRPIAAREAGHEAWSSRRQALLEAKEPGPTIVSKRHLEFEGKTLMERRAFVIRMAAGLGAAKGLVGFARAAEKQIQSLGEELRAVHDDKAMWARVQKEFLLKPGLIHLNTGSLGATPRPVVDAAGIFMHELETDPVPNEFGPMGVRMEAVRAQAAEFLGAKVEEMVVTQNTTEGMNAVATGLDLKPGDEVLSTNHEHPGGMICWEYLAKHRGIKIVQIPMPEPVRDKAQVLQLIKDHLTPRTRVCSFQHVDTITGMRMPLADIAAITRPRDILFVCDGAQAPGMLNVDVKALGVDTYASSSHKWMLAPKGSGLLYIRKEVQDRVQPVLLFSGYNVYTASSGTRDLPHILAHGVAMDFHNAIGRDRVEARCLELNGHLRRRFAKISSMRLLTPLEGELSSGLVSYSLRKGDNNEVYNRLHLDHDIVVKVVPKADLNALRFSTHINNDEEQIDRAADALEKLLPA